MSFAELPAKLREKQLFTKARRLASGLPLVRHVIALYFAFTDPQTPSPAKATIVLALAYFVLPFDLIPDMVAGLGYTDDAAVVVGALKALGTLVTPAHYTQADAKLGQWRALPSGATGGSAGPTPA